jgi:hypothetical protein
MNALRLAGIALFLAVLFATDRALARWGSQTIRRRPRPGFRITAVFVSVVAAYVLVALLAQWSATWSSALGWVVLALAFPACAVSALAVDQLLPDTAAD